MSKKNKKRSKTIGEPKSSIQLLSSVDFTGFLQNGYHRLSDNPEVKIAVSRIADLVSNMTIQLMENTDKGDKRVFNALSRKVDINPCEFMTRKSWLYRICEDLLLNGNGNAILHVEVDVETGLIANLKPFPMKQTVIKSTDYSYYIEYDDEKYDPDEIVHFIMNPDAEEYYRGTGYRLTLKNLVKNLGQAMKTKETFMSGQYLPSLIVKVDALNEEFDNSEKRTKIGEKYLKTSKAGEPWIIPSELIEIEQVKPLSIKDIALNESVELDKKTVAALFGIPAFVLGVGTFNQAEYNHFINTKVSAIGQIISQTLTRDLLISPTLYFQLNPRSLLNYNLKELVSAGVNLVKVNSLRRNELRNWIGMTPDEEMEDLLVLENYLHQDDLDKQKKLKGGDDEDDES